MAGTALPHGDLNRKEPEMNPVEINQPNAPVEIPDPSTAEQQRSAADIIGDILVQSGLITAQQLQYARRVQSKLQGPKTLISVLEEMRLAPPDKVKAALKAKPLAARLGDLLVELGYIRDSDLKMALALQQDRPESKIGELLVEHHYANEETITEVFCLQQGMERLFPLTANPEPQLMTIAPTKWLRTNNIFPIGRRDGAVVVAVADPENSKQLEIARHVFGGNAIIGIARASEIHEAIERVESRKTNTASSVINENVIVQTVQKIIADAADAGVSDIHIEPQKDKLRIRFRQDGVLIEYKNFPSDMMAPLISRVKILAKADIAEKRRHQDGRIDFPYKDSSIDLRVSVYVTIHGEKIVLRLLNTRSQILDIKKLGMSPRILQRFTEDVLDASSGVVVVTGPTGSGKTSTLYSSVNYLNNPQTSIITAEDPVEYVIDGISQCSINPKISVTFEDTLKHIVRQDPDVIVIGEIRDLFSAETAIQAALTGHKVLTTFHTEDSIGGLVRLLNMNIEPFLIASTVVSVLAQRLVRQICPHCAEDQVITPHQARRLGYEPRDVAGVSFKVGRGCNQCRFSGYKGRLAIFELLVLNEQVKDSVIERKTSYEIRRISMESTGHVTLLEDAICKCVKGLTTFEEIIRQIPRLCKPRPINEVRRLLGEVQ